MKIIIKLVGNIILGALIVALVLTIISTVQSKRNPEQIPSILGYMPMSIMSGSMRPVLEVGDMIICKKANVEDIKTDDVITYRAENSILITHRVIDTLEIDGRLVFRTQGDANDLEDDKLVVADQIVGEMLFSVPYGGYIVNFLRSPIGFMLLIAIPLIIIIFGEVRSISNNIDVTKKEESSL